MKIAVLSSHTPSLFWFRMDMMKAFIEAGCEVVAIANEPEELWKPKFTEAGIDYKQIYVERNGTNPLQDLRTLISIKQVMAEVKPDKIFSYQAKTVIYCGIAANQLNIRESVPANRWSRLFVSIKGYQEQKYYVSYSVSSTSWRCETVFMFFSKIEMTVAFL